MDEVHDRRTVAIRHRHPGPIARGIRAAQNEAVATRNRVRNDIRSL